jgi:hypothetical protein
MAGLPDHKMHKVATEQALLLLRRATALALMLHAMDNARAQFPAVISFALLWC